VEIKDMADILLKGGKMLNRSCPKCNAPLFKYEDRTFCAKCNWEEGQKQDGEEVVKPEEKQTQQAASSGKEPLATLDQLQMVVLERIREYSGRLNAQKGEGNLDLNTDILSDLLDLLERIIEIRQSLQGK
jgi:UPF0148 protein